MFKEADLERERQQAREEASDRAQKILGLETTVADLARERDQAQALAASKEQLARELDRKLGETETKLAAALKPRPPAAAVKGPEQKPMNVVAEMMKNPEMKEVIKQQQLAQLDMLYGGLFKRFSLNEAEKEDFKKLLAERVQAESDFAMRAMGGEIPQKDMLEAQKALTEAKNASDLKIKTFLNNEQDYLAYQTWEQAKPERMVLSMGQSAFASAGEPLTGAQEDQLVNAMMSARTRRTDIPDLTKAENVSPENLSSTALEKILASYDVQAQEVAATAASFLSPKQLEALKTMQQQQKAMQEMGLKMSGAMFGGKK